MSTVDNDTQVERLRGLLTMLEGNDVSTMAEDDALRWAIRTLESRAGTGV